MMRAYDRCGMPKHSSDRRTTQFVQSFPKAGLLAKSLDQPLEKLTDRLGRVQNKAYSYIVRSVALNSDSQFFEQHGSGPNFQGDALTLCTCKHQMRSRLSVDQWQAGVWIAGFTSRTIHAEQHWLFYLAKVESAYDSHSDLWSSMDADSRNAKAAHLHYLGDVFKPKHPKPTRNARFLPSRYLMPSMHAHRKKPGDTGWYQDIKYKHVSKGGTTPLLVADPKQTFIWKEPIIFLSKNHCRDYFKWTSLQELIAQLREAR